MFGLTVKLHDGTSIPWLAFGSGSIHKGTNVSTLIDLALAHGIVHLDAAQRYENEQSVGEGLASHLASSKSTSREDIFVTTKILQLQAGQSVRESLIESLEKLKLEYVDLLLIHSPVYVGQPLEKVWKGMEEVKKEGLAKHIGVSNSRIKDLERIIECRSIIPAVNQIEYHPYVHKASIDLLQYHAKHGIVTASFAGMTPLFRRTDGPVGAILDTIQLRLTKARTDGKPVSNTQVLLKWLWHKSIIAVTTTTKEERIDEYLDVPNVPDLTPEEVKAIDDAGSSIHHRVWAEAFGYMDEN